MLYPAAVLCRASEADGKHNERPWQACQALEKTCLVRDRAAFGRQGFCACVPRASGHEQALGWGEPPGLRGQPDMARTIWTRMPALTMAMSSSRRCACLNSRTYSARFVERDGHAQQDLVRLQSHLAVAQEEVLRLHLQDSGPGME